MVGCERALRRGIRINYVRLRGVLPNPSSLSRPKKRKREKSQNGAGGGRKGEPVKSGREVKGPRTKIKGLHVGGAQTPAEKG